MAHLTGLFKRGASFYLRVVLPDGHPLRGKYRNGCWVKSLGCRTHREAVRVGTIKRAEVLGGLVLSQEQPQNRADAPASTAPPNTPPSQLSQVPVERELERLFTIPSADWFRMARCLTQAVSPSGSRPRLQMGRLSFSDTLRPCSLYKLL